MWQDTPPVGVLLADLSARTSALAVAHNTAAGCFIEKLVMHNEQREACKALAVASSPAHPLPLRLMSMLQSILHL